LDLYSHRDLVIMYFSKYPTSFVNTRLTNFGVHVLGMERKELDPDVEQLLSKGLNFIPTMPPNTMDAQAKDIMDGIQRLHRSVTIRGSEWCDPDRKMSPFYVPNPAFQPEPHWLLDGTLLSLQRRAWQRLVRARQALTLTYPRSNLTSADRRGLRKLRDMDVVVRPADKNLGVTIMTKDWYDAKIQQMVVHDHKSYRQVDSVPVSGVKQELRKMLVPAQVCPAPLPTLFTKICEAIDPNLRSFMLSRAWDKAKFSIPRFYLLPKLHKNPVKARPIVSSHSWVTTPVSQALDKLLQPLVALECPQVLRDTGHVIRKLEELPTRDATMLFTADVSSLYTSIPLKAVLEAITYFVDRAARAGHLKDIWWWPTGFHPGQVTTFLVKLMEFVLYNNFFTIGNNKFYVQLIGFAMGTACAPTGANLFMAYIECKYYLLYDVIPEDPLVYYCRFIDDIFGVWRGSRAQFDKFKTALAASYPVIKLTWETSDATGAVPFLDLTISFGSRWHNTGHVDLAVHRKRLNRYLYLPWSSGHPIAMKKAFLKGELIRFVRNSSNFEVFLRDVGIFASALQARGYPAWFIRQAFTTVSYNLRKHYLYDSSKSKSSRSTTTSVGAPLVLSTLFSPLAQEANVRDILTLTRDEVTQVSSHSEDVTRVLRPADSRWINATKLPRRLRQHIRKSWPKDFS